MTRQITRLTFWWDDQPGVEPGWYAQAFDDEGDFVTDSQKVDFPVDVDLFDVEQADNLEYELRGAFPEAEIVRVQED